MMEAMNSIIFILSLIGLTFFLKGFFLTRKELSIRSNRVNKTLFESLQQKSTLLQDQLNTNTLDIFGFLHTDNEILSLNIKPKVKRVFCFIVDALRLDFMTKNKNKNSIIIDMMPEMHRILEQNKDNSILFGFKADPPTVTSQRLKGLTVGSIPTFIDISSNLNSSSIIEDSLINQILKNQVEKNENTEILDYNNFYGGFNNILTATGDDTWGSLYPTQFQKTDYFDSFNTLDLDSVDNGILTRFFEDLHFFDFLDSELLEIQKSNILNNLLNFKNVSTCCAEFDVNGRCTGLEELIHFIKYKKKVSNNKTPWVLLITHFLGVDHIGHSFHAFNPLMRQRVRCMDALLTLATELIPDDTILMFFGDHGMTDAGEHGGAGNDEILSGLFTYSKTPLFSSIKSKKTNENKKNLKLENNSTNILKKYWNEKNGKIDDVLIKQIIETPRVISQVDLVPTVSLLLNNPIPFSSVGRVIPEFFLSGLDEDLLGFNRFDQLTEVLFNNAIQVWLYLLTYYGENEEMFDGFTSKNSEKLHFISQTDMGFILLKLHKKLEILLKTNKINLKEEKIIKKYPKLIGLKNDFYDSILTHIELLIEFRKNEKNSENLDILIELARFKYTKFLQNAQNYARHEWTQFNITSLVLGLFLLFISLIITIKPFFTIKKLTQQQNSKNLDFFFNKLPSSIIYLIIPLGLGFNSLGAFSNSFLINEHWIIFSTLQACLLFFFFQLTAEETKLFEIDFTFFLKYKKLILMIISTMTMTRLFWDLQPINPFLSEHDKYTQKLQGEEKDTNNGFEITFSWVLFAILILILLNTIISYFPLLNHRGKMNNLCGFRMGLFRISHLSLGLYWLFQYSCKNGFINSTSLRDLGFNYFSGLTMNFELELLLPRMVLAFSLFAISLVFIDINTKDLRAKQTNRILEKFHLLSDIYLHLLTIVLLFLGPKLTFLLVFTKIHSLVTIYIFLNILGLKRLNDEMYSKKLGKKDKFWVLIGLSGYFLVVGRFSFFLTGHRMDFGTLQLSTGFIGKKFFNFYYAGSALLLNTFGPEILYSLFFHLFLLYLKNIEEESAKKMFLILQKSRLFFRQFSLFCNCFSAFVLRRHLMIWSIFAPKTVFEASGWILIGFLELFLSLLFPLE